MTVEAPPKTQRKKGSGGKLGAAQRSNIHYPAGKKRLYAACAKAINGLVDIAEHADTPDSVKVNAWGILLKQGLEICRIELDARKASGMLGPVGSRTTRLPRGAENRGSSDARQELLEGQPATRLAALLENPQPSTISDGAGDLPLAVGSVGEDGSALPDSDPSEPSLEPNA